MRSIVLALCVLAIAPARAADAPGSKWLECSIGKGGFTSAEAVYRAVIDALVKGDVPGLAATRLDDCAWFRIAATAGYAMAGRLMEPDDSPRDEKLVPRLRARIEVEGVDLAKAPFTVASSEHELGPMLMVTTRTDMRLRLEVTTVSIDGRWYLWQSPTLAGNDEALAKRYGALVRELDKRLGKRSGDDAIAIMDAWQKQRAAELDKLALAAAATRSGAPMEARKTLEAKFKDDVLARKRVAGLGFGAGMTGIIACDDFLDRMWRCIEHMPVEVRPAISRAMAETAEAWMAAAQSGSPEIHAALEQGCGQASQAVASGMAPMCPGIW